MHALNGLTGLRCVEVVEADALATLLGFVNSKVDEAELKAADIEAAAPVTPANAATNADWPMPLSVVADASLDVIKTEKQPSI